MNEPKSSSLLNGTTATQLADLFRTLGDPSRIQIVFSLIDKEFNVGQLAEITGLSQSATSHQLRTLRQMRVVRSRKQGRTVYYSLDDKHVAELISRAMEHVLHG